MTVSEQVVFYCSLTKTCIVETRCRVRYIKTAVAQRGAVCGKRGNGGTFLYTSPYEHVEYNV